MSAQSVSPPETTILNLNVQSMSKMFSDSRMIEENLKWSHDTLKNIERSFWHFKLDMKP